jgi:NADH-quinone oxidoreductase subunit E
LGLFLQIVVFLIVAAALGFAVGWLLRGTRLEEDRADASEPLRTRLGSAEQERDRLRGELAAAREANAAAERAQRDAEQSAAAGDPELKARATRLERELEEARAGLAAQKSETERLEMVVAELEVGAAEAPAVVAPVADLPAGGDAGGANGGAPPESLPGPEGAPDDLKRISGIGPGIEKTLHELGVFHFRQIAAFTPANVAWVNRRLRFKGRIEREDWIGQARTLMAGGETEFSQRQPARPS